MLPVESSDYVSYFRYGYMEDLQEEMSTPAPTPGELTMVNMAWKSSVMAEVQGKSPHFRW